MRTNFKFDASELKEMFASSIKPLIVSGVSSFNAPEDNTVIFAKSFDKDKEKKLSTLKNCLLILPKTADPNYEILGNNQVIFSENPRRDYALILQLIVDKMKKSRKYIRTENGSVIGENSVIGEGTVIEPFVFIDEDVRIGRNCQIKSGARIQSNVEIGDNTIVRDNAVLGGQGFGVETDEDGKTVRIPHLGGVKVGDNVDIGTLSGVDSGTIDPTIIDDHVQIDDLVHVAHNCRVGSGTLVAGGALISGSVFIGEKCWLGPGCVISNGVKIGDGAFVSLGSVVVSDVKPNQKVTGNFAMDHNKFLRNHIKMRKNE